MMQKVHVYILRRLNLLLRTSRATEKSEMGGNVTVKNYIGVDYTSQTRFDLDWCIPHPCKRSTGIIKFI